MFFSKVCSKIFDLTEYTQAIIEHLLLSILARVTYLYTFFFINKESFVTTPFMCKHFILML